MSATPITDAEAVWLEDGRGVIREMVSADTARELECKLAEATNAVCAVLLKNGLSTGNADTLADVLGELDLQLREGNDRWKALKNENEALVRGIAEANANAPWLSAAHALCADMGVPPGNIEWRIEVLRGVIEALRVDGERLDWANSHARSHNDEILEIMTEDNIRAAIDAARSRECSVESEPHFLPWRGLAEEPK